MRHLSFKYATVLWPRHGDFILINQPAAVGLLAIAAKLKLEMEAAARQKQTQKRMLTAAYLVSVST
jgi:hypothetical protein